MILPNSALLKRSIMVDSRLKSTYVFRAAMVLIIMVYMILLSFFPNLSATGLKFFSTVSIINLLFITFLGCSVFSDVITEEKEVNSLNLLLMTGLSPLIMLLSKSASKFWLGASLLLVQIPFTFMAVTLGGISIFQILEVYISTLIYIFLVCNISLLASVISRRTAQAMVLSFIFLVLLFIFNWLIPVSPFTCIDEILTTGFTGNLITKQFYACLIVGLSCFFLSWLIFNRFTRESVSSSPSRMMVATRRSKLPMFRISRAWNEAIYWKEFYFSAGGRLGLYLRILIYSFFALVVLSLSYFSTGALMMGGGFIVGFGMFINVIDAGFISSSSFNQETLGKTWSTLYMLPLTPEDILKKKIKGILYNLVPGAIFMLVGLLLIMISSPSDSWVTLVFGVPFYLLCFRFYLYLSIYFSIRFKYAGSVLAFMAFLFLYFLSCIGLLIVLVAPSILKRKIIEKIQELAMT